MFPSKPTYWVSVLVLGLAVWLYFKGAFPDHDNSEFPESIYDFTVKDINGNDVPLRNYRGKILLIVNVASRCGLTESNYRELNILYEKYKDQGLEILAFPCNQFGQQEPGTNEEIQEAVCSRFKAEFPIFDKIEVNGENAGPLYKFLKKEKGGVLVNAIKWNFTKFLVSKEGKVVDRYAPTTLPLAFEKNIQNLLAALNRDRNEIGSLELVSKF